MSDEKLTIEQVAEILKEKGYCARIFVNAISGGFKDSSSGFNFVKDGFVIEPNNEGSYMVQICNVSLEQALNIVLGNVKVGENIETPQREPGPQYY